jgi:hypothetical protein
LRQIIDASSFQPRKHEYETIIETVVEKPAVKPAPKKRAKAIKEYPPHEHFGSPLNVCRICGEKYTYVQKPYDQLAANQPR